MKKRVIYQYKDAEIDVDVEAHDAESWTDQRHLLAMVQQVLLCAEGWGDFEMHIVRQKKTEETVLDEETPTFIHPDGTQEWRVDGRRHREGGPAVIHPDGSKEWWIEGILIDQSIPSSEESE